MLIEQHRHVVRLFDGAERLQLREIRFDGLHSELISIDGSGPTINEIHHDHHTLIGMVAGEQTFDICAEGAAVWRGSKGPGGMAFYPAGRRMTSRFALTRMTTLVSYFHPEASFEALGVEPPVQWQTRTRAEDPFSSTALLQLADLMRRDDDPLGLLMCETLMTVLLLQCLRRFSDRGSPATRGEESLAKVLDLIHSELPRAVSLSELVTASGLPKARFLMAFRLKTGMSPHQYIVRERLARACVLLRTTRRNLGDIASEVGCSNPGHLARMFHQEYRVSPRVWRHRNSIL